MKINIIGPSCVGKTTLAKMVAKRHGWEHFDLDLVFIDRDYLAETKIFRYRLASDYRKRIDNILKKNKNWIIEGVYPVEKIFKEADIVILIKPSIMVPLRWQWKRYFSDRNQRDTYGLLNNIGLTRDIFSQYLRRSKLDDIQDETRCYLRKYDEMLKKYKNKVKVVVKIDDLEKLRRDGSYDHL